MPEVLSTYSRRRAQFFPIRNDLGWQITCLLFSSVEYFVSSFCVEFSLQPFSNLVYACVTFRKKEIIRIGIHNCLLLRSLFTFYILCSEKKTARKDAKAGKLVAVRMGKSGPLERAQLVNQIQGFRIPDRSYA